MSLGESLYLFPVLFLEETTISKICTALLMPPSTVPAALVGKAAAAVAGLAYLNARFSIGQDINFLLGRRAAFAALTKTGEALMA